MKAKVKNVSTQEESVKQLYQNRLNCILNTLVTSKDGNKILQDIKYAMCAARNEEFGNKGRIIIKMD